MHWWIIIYLTGNLLCAIVLHILTLTEVAKPPTRAEFYVFVILVILGGLPILVCTLIWSAFSRKPDRSLCGPDQKQL
jgi:hypothetical protein